MRRWNSVALRAYYVSRYKYFVYVNIRLKISRRFKTYLNRGVFRASFVIYNNAHRFLYSIDIRIRAYLSTDAYSNPSNDSRLMEEYC